MTPDERQLLVGLFDRIHAASGTPRDRDAEALIADAVRDMPFAPYLLAQTVLVQEEALRAASERVHQLEARVRDLEARAAQPAPEATSFLGGIGKSIFGASAPAPTQAAAPASGPWGRVAAPPPPAQQPTGGWGQQQPQPGPWSQSAPPAAGGGFLKGALGAAAGVAGGVLLADSIRGLMGGHNSAFGSGFGQQGIGGFGGGETVVNNYYENDPRAAALHDQDVRDDAISDAADGYDTASYDDGGSSSDDTTDV